MKAARSASLDQLSRAGSAIFVCGLCAASIGLGVSRLTHDRIFVATNSQRAVVDATVGLCLGVFGTAVGGRAGWGTVGAVCGVILSFLLVAALSAACAPPPDGCREEFGAFVVCLSVGLGLAGCSVGKSFASRFERAPEQSLLLRPLAILVRDSELYKWPLLLRLALGFLEAAPVVTAAPSLVRHFAGH